jgi:hypothetical protein
MASTAASASLSRRGTVVRRPPTSLPIEEYRTLLRVINLRCGVYAVSREPVEDTRDIHGEPHALGRSLAPAHSAPWFGHSVQKRHTAPNVWMAVLQTSNGGCVNCARLGGGYASTG